MADDKNKNLPEEEETNNYIILTDEDGNELELEILAELEHEGKHYCAMCLEVEDSDPQLVYMIRTEDEEGYLYDIIEDDEENMKVDEMFREILSEEFNIE